MGLLNVDIIYSGMPRIPLEGEEVFSSGFDLKLGGGPAATLINLHRLGVPVRLGTFLGEDLFSQYARKVLRTSGLRYRNLCRRGDGALTVTSIISTARDRTFVSHRPNDAESGVPQDRVYDFYRGSTIAYIPLGHHEVFRRLKEEGATLLLDSNWREDLSLELYQQAFSYVDYFTPNEKEACRITGTDSALDAIRILARHVSGPIVKLGADGCLFCDGSSIYHAPGISDFPFVDSTGAGDAFLSGFIYGLCRRLDLASCIRLGNLVGAKCVAGVGCLAESFDETGLLAWERRTAERKAAVREVSRR
jgi:ribokinase